MNVKKEVYDKCKSMVERELSAAKYKLHRNKIEINRLAKEQRILKAQIGKLHEVAKDFKY